MTTKILLTGATGFIGRSCLNLLRHSNFEIHALHRGPKLELADIYWYQCDIHNHNQVSQYMQHIQADYLIHFAWFVEHQLFWTSEKNIDYIQSTLNLYKHFSLNGGIKAVFIGTCAEYLESQSIYTEDKTPLQPKTLYGQTKKQTFELLTNLRNQDKKFASFVWARLFNIFGPYENSKRLIPYIFNSYLDDKYPKLNNPSSKRDFLYVDDFNSIIFALLRSEFTGAVNTGNGEQLSIYELATIIHDRYFTKLPEPIFSTINTSDDHLIPHLGKLQSLQIKPEKNVIDRLDETYQWWLTQGLRAQHDNK